MESGKRNPTLDLLERIAIQLKVPVELILLEARQSDGQLSPEQTAVLNQAKQLVLLASRIEEDRVREQNQKTAPALAQDSDEETSGPATRHRTYKARRRR